jgi:hypothetical protein
VGPRSGDAVRVARRRVRAVPGRAPRRGAATAREAAVRDDTAGHGREPHRAAEAVAPAQRHRGGDPGRRRQLRRAEGGVLQEQPAHRRRAGGSLLAGGAQARRPRPEPPHRRRVAGVQPAQAAGHALPREQRLRRRAPGGPLPSEPLAVQRVVQRAGHWPRAGVARQDAGERVPRHGALRRPARRVHQLHAAGASADSVCG